MKTIIPVAVITMSILFSCEASKSTQSPGADNKKQDIQPLTGKWFLKKIYQSTGNTDVTNSRSYVNFDTTKRSAGGNGGCNAFGSTYSYSDSVISIKGIFSTKMYCEQYQKQEDAFFDQLEKVNRYKTEGNKLLLYLDNDLLLELGR